MAITTANGVAAGSKKRKRIAVEEANGRPKSKPKDLPVVTKAVVLRQTGGKSKSKKRQPVEEPSSEEEEDDSEDASEDGSDEDGDAGARSSQKQMLQIEEAVVQAITAKARTKGLEALISLLEVCSHETPSY